LLVVSKKIKYQSFKSAADFRKWLSTHHRTRDELWLRFYKKDSGKPSVTYAEAVDEALCFGWIDGQVRKLDTLSWIQRYTPRRARSGWSKRNTEHAMRLIASKRMRAAGLAQIRQAQSDGRWSAAYDSPATAKPPADFLRALSKNLRAKAHFAKLGRAGIYSICYRLQTAKKPETRARRLAAIIGELADGEFPVGKKNS
jgi:uncharacterized protein YdeI (YjbR/CyaY-like superfamily)